LNVELKFFWVFPNLKEDDLKDESEKEFEGFSKQRNFGGALESCAESQS
jgi:hypothetical protein